MSEVISRVIDLIIAALYGALLYGALIFLPIAGLGLAAFIFCTQFLSMGG